MRIALFGYGKMGKVIEKIALERGHEITARVTRDEPKERFDLSNTDVVIEFSIPESAEENIRYCLDNDVPIVIGTTGWYDHLETLSSYCIDHEGAMLYATNFSLGVNIFFELNRQLAKIMSKFPDYKASLVETHHTEKLDAPSGTGITIAEDLIAHHNVYKSWENVKKSEITDENVLSIESLRLPKVPGTHEVLYESSVDKIEMIHTAHNREGFGLGSVLAAEWIVGKKGVFTMKDVLNF
ncbi:MAG: 4-hydroxy-tetrahydrodipicolinate reductase [Crocinitomicaceae bacterium]|nr:4-hydroxy-tetrahydrodipicolinate reductase [Crocinitomicaceae bacterium]